MEAEISYPFEPRFLSAVREGAVEPPTGYRMPDLCSGLPKGTPMLLGFSGGIDSSVLLLLAYAYAKENGAPLRLVHLHHGIRGDEADRDADFAQAVADAYGLPITIARRDVPAIAKSTGESLETAARRVRYEVFTEVMREHGIPLLLVAHNADDNLETVLFHLCRGSALSGLSGIPQSRDLSYGRVIRPLLSVTRRDIEAFGERYAVPSVFDSTNDDVAYTRNRLRREIVPLLREISPAPERAVARMTASLSRDREFLDGLAEEALRRARRGGGLQRSVLKELPDAIALRVLLAYWRESIPTLDSYESLHLEALLDFTRNGRSGTHLSLRGGSAAVTGSLLTVAARSETVPIEEFSLTLRAGESVETPYGATLSLSDPRDASLPDARENPKNIYNSATQIYIPFDTINKVYEQDGLTVRSRLPGDRILLRGMHRSLRTLLNGAGFTEEARRALTVVTDGEQILWVPGLAVSDLVSRKRTDSALTLTLVSPPVSHTDL